MYYKYKNINVYYEIFGEGKPILCIHGFGCDHKLMTGCMEPVFRNHDGYQRIYVDLPGMGKTKGESEFNSSDKILEVLVSMIQDLTDDNFLLAGESYGGYLARGILSKLHERVDGMLLLCPVVVPKHEDRILPQKETLILDKQLNTKENQEFIKFAVIANQAAFSRYQDEIETGIKIADLEFLKQVKESYAFTFDVDEVLRQNTFQKPALFLCGRQDNSVGYQDLWKLVEDYPRAEFAVLDMAGHNLQIEQPMLFEAFVNNWITRMECY